MPTQRRTATVKKELTIRTVKTAKVDLAEDRDTYGRPSPRYRKTSLHALMREEEHNMRNKLRGTPGLPTALHPIVNLYPIVERHQSNP
jgi:hypothetical protein